jgi:hypothetical protein
MPTLRDEEQLALLTGDVQAWNDWRAHNTGTKIKLVGANFVHANLTHADLHGADLNGALFGSADLQFADLRRADLTHANLGGARLSHADLSGAYLFKTILMETNLEEVILDGTIFEETAIASTDLRSCRYLDRVIHQGPSAIDFSTLETSWPLPLNFLRGCGLPELYLDYLPSLLNPAIHFHSCFISYSHADKVFARRLHDRLQARGIRCWLDHHQLLPGDDLHHQIQRGVRLWDKVLLCCSSASLTSWWVDNEIETALNSERELMKARGRKVLKLIPLDIDGYLFSGNWTNGKEEQIKSRLAADFVGWENDDATFDVTFERVVRSLVTDDKGREPPPLSKL